MTERQLGTEPRRVNLSVANYLITNISATSENNAVRRSNYRNRKIIYGYRTVFPGRASLVLIKVYITNC